MQLRVVLLAFGALALLTGLYGGLWRLGWAIPRGGSLSELHGPLMICGLFGTLIGLERAVAAGKLWSYLAPAFSALGSLALLTGLPQIVGIGCYVVSAVVFSSVSFVIALRHQALFTGTLLLGALALLAGDLVWMTGASVSEVVAWWLAFLILTIAGERLELSRILPPKTGSKTFFSIALALLTAGAWFGISNATGASCFGAGLLACSAWLLRHDIALRNIWTSGQTRFFAACMLAGYGWLAIAGVLLIIAPPFASPLGYDMALHAIAIGFVLSMVFGHALIILPAVVGVRIPYSAAFYLPLGILHIAVLMRIFGGYVEAPTLRLCSGVLTITALLLFACCAASSRYLRYSDSVADHGPIARARQVTSPASIRIPALRRQACEDS